MQVTGHGITDEEMTEAFKTSRRYVQGFSMHLAALWLSRALGLTLISLLCSFLDAPDDLKKRYEGKCGQASLGSYAILLHIYNIQQ